MADENETVVSAPVSTAAWIYVFPKDKELLDVLSVLSLMERNSPVVISPLLMNLTVENDFSTTVKTPITNFGGTILTKITSFMPVCFFFHGTEQLVGMAEDHGDLIRLCEQTRQKFHLQSFEVPTARKVFDIKALCSAVGKDADSVICHVACGNGFKELLFAGLLIPCVEEQIQVQVGEYSCVKIPLYSATLFETEETISLSSCTEFIQERGFFLPALSETLFYYVFTSWGTTLRFSNTKELIDAGLKQFTQDGEQTVKLAPHKTYLGISGQKISAVEKDFLMLVDSVVTELSFSHVAEYLDSVYDPSQIMNFNDWPIIRNSETHAERMAQLTNLKLHLSSHLAVLIFAPNSILYCSKLAFIPNVKQAFNSVMTQELLLRSLSFCNALSSLSEDVYNDNRKIIKCDSTSGKDDKFSANHLAYACATSPQLLSYVVWNLNRMSVYNAGNAHTEIYNHLVNCSANLCEFCDGKCCQSCIGTAMVRVGTRLPAIPKNVKKEPLVMSMFSRYYAEVDILGSFGRKPVNELKEIGKDQQNTLSLDRGKFVSQIFDYCKKNSLIDPVTGEDTFNVRSKKDFVSIIHGLTQCIEECVSRCIVEMRRTQTPREQIENCLQSFNVDTTPYATAFSPFLTFSYYKVILTVLQNLALIVASGHVVDRPCTGNSISKWLVQQYQSLYGTFHSSYLKKGFLNTRTVKVASNVDMEQILDCDLYKSGKYVKTTIQAKLCRLSMQCLRDFRIKNRPFNKSSKTAHNNPYFKKNVKHKKNPLSGCISFLLFKYHDKLFPNVKISCLELWQRFLLNNVPKTLDIGNPEEVKTFIKFAFSITNTYDEIDIIDIQPECLSTFIDCYFHNKFLSALGFHDYLTSLHGLTSKLVTQNPVLFPVVLDKQPKFSSIQEYLVYVKKLVLDGVPNPVIASLSKEPNFGTIFTSRSLVTFGLTLEKFVSLANREYFQFGQLGWIGGSGVDRNLNPTSSALQDFRFMRQKTIIATKFSEVIVKKVRREAIMFDTEVVKGKVLSIVENLTNDIDPELLIIAEVMRDREDKPTMDDMLFFVDGREALAASIMLKLNHLVDMNVRDFSITNLQSVFEAVSSNDAPVYDFSEILAEEDDQGNGVLKCDETETETDEPMTKKNRL
uniref:Single-stranded DNA-binding protein n=2 Tax=Roseolovirus TaxID=40272 RepID=A0A219Y0U2_9BETA|nr:single-stranded DNA-binding protein [Human betaherpesvirus 6A]ARM10172.1 DBP [Human betaherpesvirus 6]AVK93440.1 U41 [Human betaherpesvirus 6A]QOI15222.1 single-stranded DNA-binding protein [Human betaherpesvirus 6A]QOI15394.1 single-stranded DNA-binding protein [Human betaherpesvirus 6A]